jgi:hypothetical protein
VVLLSSTSPGAVPTGHGMAFLNFEGKWFASQNVPPQGRYSCNRLHQRLPEGAWIAAPEREAAGTKNSAGLGPTLESHFRSALIGLF